MKSKQLRRRLRFLCSKNPPSRIEDLDQLIAEKQELRNKIKGNGFKSEFLDNYLEMLLLFKKLEFAEDEVFDYWKEEYYGYRIQRSVYKQKPVTPKKDNPNLYGEQFRGGGTLRKPKKVRKGANKRFKKLFPCTIEVEMPKRSFTAFARSGKKTYRQKCNK